MALKKERLEVRVGKMESEGGLLKQIVVQLPLEMQNLREELTNLKQEMTAAITALTAATTTAVNAVRQEMNERFAQVDQKFDHSLPPKRGR